jgi:predicted ester cyclase
MSNKRMRLIQSSGFLVALSVALSALALAAGGVTIGNPFVASTVAQMQSDATAKAARAFYEFLNTGDEALLKQAVAENFTDHTLPLGRPQGLDGLSFALRRLRAAVPDLKVTLVKMIVADDYVTLLMNFAGHFTGTFDSIRGKDQPISFIATDLLRVVDGRIADSWHVKDNLALLQQMGVAKVNSQLVLR